MDEFVSKKKVSELEEGCPLPVAKRRKSFQTPLPLTPFHQPKPSRPKYQMKRTYGTTKNIADFLLQREQTSNAMSHLCYAQQSMTTSLMIRKNFIQNKLQLPKYSKVFSSKWISDDVVLMGTKCSNLLSYNYSTNKQESIKLPSNGDSELKERGIYSIATSPTMSRVAVTGKRSDEITVLELPSLEPLSLFSEGHSDTIFDMEWISDDLLVSVSRDQFLCLWNTREGFSYQNNPVCKRNYQYGRLRGLAYNKCRLELCILCGSGLLLLTDAEHLQLKSCMFPLPPQVDAKCISFSEEKHVYAIASKHGISLIDANYFKPIQMIINDESCVRCVTFRGNHLFYGTTNGEVAIYDMRNTTEILSSYKVGKCVSTESASSIFTLSNDPTGTKLFVGGGDIVSSSREGFAYVFD